jgi:hypothetical protein
MVSCQHVGAIGFVIYVIAFLRKNLGIGVWVYFEFQVDKVSPPYSQMHMLYAEYFLVAEESASVKAFFASLSPFLLLMDN